MKKTYLGSLLVLFYSFGCNAPETTSDLNEEVVWQNESVTIKNVNDSLATVVITGLQREDKYQLSYSLIVENKAEIVLSGKIYVFGELNSDGIPAFYHEDITETADTLFGWRHLIHITPDQKFRVLDGVFSSISKRMCKQQVGFEESFEFNNDEGGKPKVVLNGVYGYLDNSGDCNSFQHATSKISYEMRGQDNYLTRVDVCPVESGKVDLSVLYQQDKFQLRELKKLRNNYYSLYDYGSKLRACGDDGNDGISHLEAIAGVPIKNGNNIKRTDIMPHIEEEFTNINPAFVIWAKDNLIPNPTNAQANGLTYNFLYQYGYKQQLRKFALLKLIIMQQGQEQLMKEYADASYTMQYIEEEERLVRRDNFNTYSFLQSKLAWATQEFNNLGFDPEYLESADYGFLLRRMLDGSEPAIWQTMQKILKLYDNTWYNNTFINKKWAGLASIDSTTYYNKRALSGIDGIILAKEAVPEGIAVVNGAGITLTCKEGKEVTFINNNNDGESFAEYELMGYWPAKNIVLVHYSGWEISNIIFVYIDNGKSEYRNNRVFPSKDGNFLAGVVEEMEYSAIQLYKLEGEEWVQFNEQPQQSIADGFWLNGKFYFKSEEHYFTFEKLDFNTEVVASK